MITPYNILRHELIGLFVKAVGLTAVGVTHDGYNVSGTIVGETRNTLKIEDMSGNLKILPKNSVVLDITLPKETVVRIDGNLLVAKPEDRIKKKYRIKFA